MNAITLLIAAVLGVGLWGYFYRGDPLYVINILSASEIAQYASDAGFTGDDLVTAVAIALAESGGDPKANGDTQLTPGGSIGLWQINLAAHPEYAGVDLTDPVENAQAAFHVYQQASYSFTPWSTFKGGQYLAHLNDAQSAVVTG